MNEPRYQMQDLVYLMQRLRDPEKGCPWDLKQNYRSIVPSTLEEVYEVVEAIEQDDLENLREELGDLLFQVVFYSQLASETGSFTFNDVAHAIVSKLVRRHPHVFPSGSLYQDSTPVVPLSDEQLHAQWDRIKQEEKSRRSRAQEGVSSLLADIPQAIPALQRAYKIQKKLASVGFDWSSAEELFPVLAAEIEELRVALAAAQRRAIEEEAGDVLFAAVNLCRHLGLDPETALRAANRKVEQRFAYVEKGLQMQGKTPAAAHQPEMERLWQEAKRPPPPG